VKKSVYSPEQIVLQELLRRLRLEAKMLQGELAQRLEKPQSFVSRFEGGAVMLDMPQLRQICLALNISLRDFVDLYEAELKDRGL
jgi:transcriptional regulator with XRE-family HTH domain